MKKIYLAGGCFWCISNTFLSVPGIKDVISGYSGGSTINPTYEQVKSQETHHRETIELIYDENIVSIDDILNIYFNNVDPFDNEGQFIDKGESYKLALFYQNNEEKEQFVRFLQGKQKLFDKKIYIDILEFKCFYKAEEYHQKYSIKNKEAFEKELIESGRKK